MNKLEIISSLEDFHLALPLLLDMYPNYSKSDLENMFQDMLLHNYQILVYKEDNQVVGLTGFWLATKFWSGKYCEIDNFIIHPDYRNKKIGQKIVQKILEIAKSANCQMVSLDSYTHNFQGHKFFFREGFVIKGYHFVLDL